MDKKFEELSRELREKAIEKIAESTPRDEMSERVDFEGDLEIEGLGVIKCRGYISPDGKVLRYMVGSEGPFQALSEVGAQLGFSVGDNLPAWAE